MNGSKVRATLVSIGAITPANVYQFSPRTRDREVPVFRDSDSGVIFIDDFYVGDGEYETGEYRNESSTSPKASLEDFVDTQRRSREFLQYYYGRKVLDFGCGAGNFLRSITSGTLQACGVELQSNFRNSLIRDGIPCFDDLSKAPPPVDAVFMFHVLEHLPDPLTILTQARALLDPLNGVIVVEVPHARDFLISQLACQPFIDFTLWSQHLVLHTRESLTKLLRAAGFVDIRITGVQRYGLANHLTWLAEGRPGGHKGPLSLLESAALAEAYRAALAAQDSTDTLVAVARVGR